MAATLAGSRLSSAHRVAQGRIAAAASVDLLRVWPLLDVEAIDSTVARWMDAALPIVDRHRRRSQELARVYYEQLRRAEAPDLDPIEVAELRPLPTNQAATSLLVTGPIAIKSGTAYDIARAASAAAGARQALSGGRDVITDTASSDPEVKRLRRLTRSDCCHFCAMLATRDQLPPFSGGHWFQAHDNCKCQPEPEWSAGARQSDVNAKFARIWRESTDGVGSSGYKKLNAFRRALAAERAG